jgi:hypothetical protein
VHLVENNWEIAFATEKFFNLTDFLPIISLLAISCMKNKQAEKRCVFLNRKSYALKMQRNEVIALCKEEK